jgi:uncharacterized protein YjdB
MSRTGAGWIVALVAVALPACQEGGLSPADRTPRLELVAGDAQTAEVGGLVLPSVRVLYGGRTLPNMAVSWATDGDAVVDDVTRSNAQGIASAQWILGSRPGVYHLTVSGVGPRPLQLTATAHAGALAAIRLRPDSGVLASVVDSLQLTASAADRFGNALATPVLSWTSLDPLVAVVGSAGLVRGRSGGTARVVVNAGGPADTALIRVIQVPGQVTVTPDGYALHWLKATLALHARVRDAYGNDMPASPVTWSSMAPTVLRVDAAGLVTALAVGAGGVVARSGTAADTVTVTVDQVVEGIRVRPIEAQVAVGDSTRLVATTYDLLDSLTQPMPLIWVSSNDTTATVRPTGWVLGGRIGSATIRVSSGYVFGTALITVVAPPGP